MPGLLKFPLKWLFGARIYYVNDLLGHLDLYLHDFLNIVHIYANSFDTAFEVESRNRYF